MEIYLLGLNIIENKFRYKFWIAVNINNNRAMSMLKYI